MCAKRVRIHPCPFTFNQKAVERLRGAGGHIAFGDDHHHHNSITASSSQLLSDRHLFAAYNDEEEERDTSYVLAALSESRHSLKLLEGHCSEDTAASGSTGSITAGAAAEVRPVSVRQAEAMTFVQQLLCAKLVYRTMHKPVGHVQLDDPQQVYSVRGYFLPAMGPGYQFISHIPLRQHWRIDAGVCVWERQASLADKAVCVLLLIACSTHSFIPFAVKHSAGP